MNDVVMIIIICQDKWWKYEKNPGLSKTFPEKEYER